MAALLAVLTPMATAVITLAVFPPEAALAARGGGLPTTTRGRRGEPPDHFIRRAYPGCRIAFDSNNSGASGRVQSFIITKPGGRRVSAMIEFVPDRGQRNRSNASQTGHFRLTERRL